MSKINKTINFGEHLTIDGYGGNPGKLNDKALVLHCLEELPNILKMEKLSQPQAYLAPDNNKKDPGGWTGFVIIAESHISIHTFPKRKFISADVYTCGEDLNADLIIRYFKDRFELAEVETNFIKRGTRYPADNLE